LLVLALGGCYTESMGQRFERFDLVPPPPDDWFPVELPGDVAVTPDIDLTEPADSEPVGMTEHPEATPAT
jgi:hypothetical protein